jgi:nucleoside-diphosphate-sugar epimerase
VARYCARSFDLPVTIARMCAAYSDQGGLPVWHLHAVAAGEPVRTRWDPMTYSPIHDDDICAQLEPLLDAASVPATIVNWGGDEPVSVQQWSAYFGELLGVEARVVVEEIPGASRGAVADHTKRRSIAGPCRVGWREGFRRVAAQFYPDRVWTSAPAD